MQSAFLGGGQGGWSGDDDFIQTWLKMRLVRPLAITNVNIPRKNIKINRKGKLCSKNVMIN